MVHGALALACRWRRGDGSSKPTTRSGHSSVDRGVGVLRSMDERSMMQGLSQRLNRGLHRRCDCVRRAGQCTERSGCFEGMLEG